MKFEISRLYPNQVAKIDKLENLVVWEKFNFCVNV